VPQRGENLAREIGHRGLAAGARHRNRGLRLGAIETRRHQRQRPARLGRYEQWNPRRDLDLRPSLGQHRRHALGHGLGHEAAAVGLGTTQRREQPSRPHLAAVGREAGDRDLIVTGGSGGLRADKLIQVHCASIGSLAG
jgi:hypothetical protein